MAKRKDPVDAPAQAVQEPQPTFGYCCLGCRQLIQWTNDYTTITPCFGLPHDCQVAMAAFVTMQGVRWGRPQFYGNGRRPLW